MTNNKSLAILFILLLFGGANASAQIRVEVSSTQPSATIQKMAAPEAGEEQNPPKLGEVVQVASRGEGPKMEASEVVLHTHTAALGMPHAIIARSIRNALEAIQAHKETFEENPNILTQELVQILEPVVAFEAIARAVMGKYYTEATEEQRTRFINTFKDRMSEFYTRIMVTFEAEKIAVLPPREEEDTSSSAQVRVEVITRDNAVYSVIYAMRKNGEGQWQARNVIVNGINLGLTYRNQFYGAMGRYDGNIDRVISTWGAELQQN